MRNTVFSLIVIMVFSVNGFSQIEISTSLNKAIEQAINKNSTIKNKQLEVQKLQLDQKGIWNKYLPHVESVTQFSYLDGHLNMDLPAMTLPFINLSLPESSQKLDYNSGLFSASIMAKSVLFSGFQIPNGAKAVQQKIEGSAYLIDAEKDVIIKDLIHTFDQLTILNEVEKIIIASEKRLVIENNRIEKAIGQGLAIPFDREKIKLAQLELKMQKADLKGKRSLLLQNIQNVTNYSTEEILQVHNTLSPIILTEEIKLSSHEKQEIKALEAFSKGYDFMLKKEKGTYLPNIGAFGGINYAGLVNTNIDTHVPVVHQPISLEFPNTTLGPDLMVGVALKWELFSGFERHHNLSKVKINKQQVQNQLDDTKEKLQLLLNNNLNNYQVLNEKLAIAEQSEQIANNNLTIAIKQYQEGLIVISERIEAENDLLKLSLNKINIIVEQRLAAMETLINTGLFTKYITIQ